MSIGLCTRRDPRFRFESNQSKSRQWNSEIFEISKLSLRELEALARALLSAFLALFITQVTRNRSGLLERRPQVAVIFNQGGRDPVANRTGLAGWATAGHVNQHIELGSRFRQVKRLTNDHAVCFVGKVRLEGFPIDQKITC